MIFRHQLTNGRFLFEKELKNDKYFLQFSQLSEIFRDLMNDEFD